MTPVLSGTSDFQESRRVEERVRQIGVVAEDFGNLNVDFENGVAHAGR